MVPSESGLSPKTGERNRYLRALDRKTPRRHPALAWSRYLLCLLVELVGIIIYWAFHVGRWLVIVLTLAFVGYMVWRAFVGRNLMAVILFGVAFCGLLYVGLPDGPEEAPEETRSSCWAWPQLWGLILGRVLSRDGWLGLYRHYGAETWSIARGDDGRYHNASTGENLELLDEVERRFSELSMLRVKGLAGVAVARFRDPRAAARCFRSYGGSETVLAFYNSATSIVVLTLKEGQDAEHTLLKHECVHALQRGLHGIAWEAWFLEGMAELLSQPDDYREGTVIAVRRLVEERFHFSFSDIRRVSSRDSVWLALDPEDSDAAVFANGFYWQSQLMVTHLAEGVPDGRSRFRKLMRELRRGRSFDRALESAYGWTPEAWEAEWHAWLASLPVKDEIDELPEISAG
ncbi:MAG: hypothetical protein AAF517_00990 [Planctomycetota bacterium]